MTRCYVYAENGDDVLLPDAEHIHVTIKDGTITAVPMRVHESIVQATWSNGRLRCNHGSSDHCTVTHTHEEPWTWVDAPGDPT